MAISDEHREFLESHRLCIVDYDRREGPPSLTPVYYVVDGDDLLFSTTRSRTKARAVQRNPELTLCVLHEEFPFPYLMVYGHAQIDEQNVPEVMARVREKMTGAPLSQDAIEELRQRAVDEGRVVIRVTPTGFVSTPARGASRAQQARGG